MIRRNYAEEDIEHNSNNIISKGKKLKEDIHK